MVKFEFNGLSQENNYVARELTIYINNQLYNERVIIIQMFVNYFLRILLHILFISFLSKLLFIM